MTTLGFHYHLDLCRFRRKFVLLILQLKLNQRFFNTVILTELGKNQVENPKKHK